MTERPILFSGPMVRAILEGKKTQTRRVIKARVTGPNPPKDYFDFYDLKVPNRWIGALGQSNTGKPEFSITCPYGRMRDKLWVRETFAAYGMEAVKPEDRPIFYRADDDTKPGWMTPPDLVWKPSIHMPRWASRLTIEIADVRVQRLQDISEDDAKAEGIRVLTLQSESDPSAWYQSSPGVNQERSARASFSGLWDSINSKRGFGWDVNPWVWAITFRRLS